MTLQSQQELGKRQNLYLNIKVHHLSYYNIDLSYSKHGLPKQLEIKLVMTNYISTPNTENSTIQIFKNKFYSQDVNTSQFYDLFPSFEKRIKSLLELDSNLKILRKFKKKNHAISREEYKARLKEMEKERSQVKSEIKKLLAELFRE